MKFLGLKNGSFCSRSKKSFFKKCEIIKDCKLLWNLSFCKISIQENVSSLWFRFKICQFFEIKYVFFCKTWVFQVRYNKYNFKKSKTRFVFKKCELPWDSIILWIKKFFCRSSGCQKLWDRVAFEFFKNLSFVRLESAELLKNSIWSKTVSFWMTRSIFFLKWAFKK